MSEPDPRTLADGSLDAWFAEVDEAIGRLFVAGTAHPPVDLGPTFALLADHARRLGSATAQTSLEELGRLVEQQTPGPPERVLRRQIAERLFGVSMNFLGWLRLFRGRTELLRAGVQHEESGQPRQDVPRFTGRMFIDGAHLDGDRLLLTGHDDDGQPLFAVDRLADVPTDDPFERPVISRLLQRSVELQSLLHGALRFEGHPVSNARRGRMLKPAFRCVPVLESVQGVEPSASESLTVFWSDTLACSEPNLRLSPRLVFNLTKLLAREPRVRLQVQLIRGRTECRLVRADAGDGVCFPCLDARCWTVSPPELERWVAGASPWVRAAATLYGEPEVPKGEGWRERWLAARTGQPPAVREGVIGRGLEAFDWVWSRFVTDAALSAALLEERFAADELGSNPDPFEVCARALLLRRHHPADSEYLDAHLAALDPEAETIVWIVFAETRCLVKNEAFGLALELQHQRMRWAHLVRAFRAGEAAEGLGDILAWGALNSWSESVVG